MKGDGFHRRHLGKPGRVWDDGWGGHLQTLEKPNTRLRVGFEDIRPTVVAEVGVCHKSPLLAIFFPSFHSSSCLLKVTLQENTKKHHILQDNSLVLITTRRGSYLINTLGLNSEVCPELIFRTICHKVISRRTSHMILSQLFHILQDMLHLRC